MRVREDKTQGHTLPTALGWVGPLFHQAVQFPPWVWLQRWGLEDSWLCSTADSTALVRLLQEAFLDSAQAGQAALLRLLTAPNPWGNAPRKKRIARARVLEMGPYPDLGFSASKAQSSPFLTVKPTFSSLNSPDCSHFTDKTESLTKGHKLVSDTASLDFQAKHLARLRWEPP